MAKYVDSTGLSHLIGLIKGRLLPTGGNSGQVLTKTSGTNYDVAWMDIQGGGTGDLTVDYGAWAESEAMDLYSAVYYDFDGQQYSVGLLPVEAGGTGADTASGALASLGAAAASHEHDAGDLTSGTLADARLPTKGSSGTAGTSSATSGATLAVPYITTDAYGRVTAKGTHTHTISGLAPTAITPIYYQAKGSGNKSLAAGTITQVTLATSGALSSGSGLSISSGGIKVATAGRYRITGSAYIAAGGTNHGAYVYRATSSGAFSAASEIFSALTTNTAAGGVLAGTKIVQCAANDIIYLAARSTGAASTCDQDSASTYLLVERLS